MEGKVLTGSVEAPQVVALVDYRRALADRLGQDRGVRWSPGVADHLATGRADAFFWAF